MDKEITTVTIYALIDPVSQAPRYVGKTKAKLEKRLKQHLLAGSKDNGCKAYWIKSLAKKGFSPGIKRLEEVEYKMGGVCERKWIDHFESLGESLFNQILC